MAATHVQTKDASVGSAASVTVNITVTAGNHLMASTGGWHSPAAFAPTAITSTPAATWANGIANFTDTNGDGLRVDYSENVAGGAWSVVGHAANSSSITVMASESAGVVTTLSIGAANHAAVSAAAATSQPGSITPTAGSVLYTMFADSSANTAIPTINLGFTVSVDNVAYSGAATERCAQAYLDNTSAVATNPTWTESSGTAQWVVGIIEFLAAGGGPPPATAVQPPMRTLRGVGV